MFMYCKLAMLSLAVGCCPPVKYRLAIAIPLLFNLFSRGCGRVNFTSVKIAFICGDTDCSVPQTVVPFFSSMVTCSLRSFFKKLTNFIIFFSTIYKRYLESSFFMTISLYMNISLYFIILNIH
ncbi:Smd1p [Saccharomyces cerevisiae Lalvin QA23]|nr:Smd1p [Saccharomyces cerevisiae Lalvin QA23]